MTAANPMLLGCGVLKREILHLIEKNRWSHDTLFLDPALHCDFDKLGQTLRSALATRRDRDVVVFYGCCHPLMEEMLEEADALRTEGQNCIEMLLGHELFMAETANGAFFVLEEWARSWPRVVSSSFGTNRLDVIREIFHTDRKYLLGLRTPCSSDFTTEAKAAARMAGLPLLWKDVALDHLEAVLRAAVAKRRRRQPCPT
ncbi:MAG: DUF1638 domain-containing protein [Verrucomicrobia bacterium]|nr:DUF1638 domain-containing protein [Verrucomicrobiota bacterium]